MIETVFGFLALTWVPWALSGLLILVAMAVWLEFRRRLRPVIAGLDQALAVVEGVAGPAQLRDRWPSIDEPLAANPIIGQAWRAFAGTLVTVPGQDDAMGATRRPAEDFNEAILTEAGVDLRFYTAVPNYLVGLGLLFTFVGLVAALYFASAGVAATNVQEAQGALRDLLSAATFKFVTSIAGLGASIVYSWREKAQLYQVGRRLGRLCTALEQRLVPISPEYLGVMQLSELRTHGTLLRRVGRNLHVTIPETIEERLASELLEAIQPLRDGFVRAASRVADLDQSLAERLIHSGPPPAVAVTAGLDGSGLNLLVEEIRGLRDALEDAVLGRGAKAPGPASAPAGVLPGVVELLDTSVRGLDALEAQIGRSLERLEAPLARVVEDLASHRSSARGAVAGELESSLAALVQARRELQGLGRAFREVSASTRAVLDAAHGPGGDQAAPLQPALDELGRRVEHFNHGVRGFVLRVDEQLARSSQLLGGVVDGLSRGRD